MVVEDWTTFLDSRKADVIVLGADGGVGRMSNGGRWLAVSLPKRKRKSLLTRGKKSG